MVKYFSLLFLFLAYSELNAQAHVKDSSLFVPMVGMSFAYQIPDGDLVKRFSNNANIGISFLIKTKKKWVFGADGSFLFGRGIKEYGIFDSITTTDGYLINKDGKFADVQLHERGYSVGLKAGRLFKVLCPNPNSGILFLTGIGVLQHKIKIYDHFNTTPQVDGDYKKGYDRLTNGIALSEFLGYVYLSNRRLVNFFGGFECMQAFTKSRRSYDYDLRKKDTAARTDLLYGFRLGWIVPLYKKAPQDFYYY